jgi:cytidylate kinase
MLEMTRKGHAVSQEDVSNDIARRDRFDSQRAVSPLQVAEGAIVVDTTGLTIQDVLQLLLKQIQED